MENIRVRFAPSPTGYLHVGGLRTALYNYLFAKKNNGKFILRIEDTDRTRLVEGAVENLIQSLKWAGLDYDEGPGKGGEFGPYTQSERLDMYKKHADELVEKGFAYYCFCSSERLEKLRESQREQKIAIKYDKHCLGLSKEEVQKRIDAGESYVIRLNIPTEGKVDFKDLVRKKIKIDFSQVDDQILIKSDGFPTYHLANVVDDHYMQISHVIRGEEWLSSVPKHLYLYRAFGWKPPKFAHLPLLLNTDKSKLSKRQADVATEDYKKNGYLPQALVNFVALLGWNAGDNKEIFSMQQLIDAFDIKRVSKAGAVFDLTKLNWMNAQYLHNADTTMLATQAKKYFVEKNIDISDLQKYTQAVDIAKNYATKLSEIVDFAVPFYFDLNFTDDDKNILLEEDSQKVCIELVNQLKNIKNEEELENIVKEVQNATGIKGKKLFFPLRLALYGKTSGPHIPALIKILGIEESIKRLSIK